MKTQLSLSILSEHDAAARAFDRENPAVYKLFERFTLEMIRAGVRHGGAKEVWERMRWHVRFETRGDAFKLNNSHTAYYARRFIGANPQHADFFRLRRAS